MIKNGLKIAGQYSLIAIVLIIGFFLYDSNPFLSFAFLGIGMGLVVLTIFFEFYLKNKELEYKASGFMR